MQKNEQPSQHDTLFWLESHEWCQTSSWSIVILTLNMMLYQLMMMKSERSFGSNDAQSIKTISFYTSSIFRHYQLKLTIIIISNDDHNRNYDVMMFMTFYFFLESSQMRVNFRSRIWMWMGRIRNTRQVKSSRITQWRSQ